MRDRTSKWYKLDNQAKIFPEVYSKKDPHTFRIQVSLNDIIEPEYLQKAVDHILLRFPMFKVQLRRGLFWTFLEENDKPFFIEPMPYKINSYMDFKANNNYLFKVFYRHKSIAVEVFHTVTDGTGLMEFVKSLVFEYLKIKNYPVTPDNMILTSKEKSLNHEAEDSSQMYYSKKNKKRIKEERALRITGTHTPLYCIKLLTGVFSTKEIIALSKQNNATVTEYLTAVMIYTIYKTKVRYRTQVKQNQHPIKIGVPVNLRTRFPSNTMRNFVNIVSVEFNATHDDVTLEEIILKVKQDVKERTTNEELQRMMSEYVSYEKNIFLRIVPSIIKSYVMKYSYSKIGSVLFTMSLSNVGRVTFPDSMKPYIHDVTFMVGASTNNNINTAIVSYEDKFKISFSSNILESNIQREFIRHFTELGLQVEMESNYLEEHV